MMVEVIAKAVSIPRYIPSAEPFAKPVQRKHMLIVGGTHLVALSPLFRSYALTASVIIPSSISNLDRDLEMERAAQFEVDHEHLCRGTGFARDLSGIDTDSVDYLFICCLYPEVRDSMLAEAWRVVREFGKVVIFVNHEIPLTYLAGFGIANPIYYPAEGFYVGTLRKSSAIRANN